MVYFSQLKNTCVFDSKHACIGKLLDLVLLDGKNYANITHIIYQDEEKNKKKIPWGFVRDFKGEKDQIHIHLNVSIDEVQPFFIKEKDTLVGGILDKQVIDVNGVKLVRVNDIMLGKVKKKFCVVAVCVGPTSFVRRLGIKKLTSLATSRIKENIIPWKSVERLESEFHDLHLNIQKDKIADLHPEDIADIMEDLTHSQRILIFNSLDRKVAAKTLIKAQENVQDSVLKSVKIDKIIELLENISTDQAADIISLMPKEKSDEILSSMKKNVAAKIEKLLHYYPHSVGTLMKTEFIAIPQDYTAQKTINLLRKMKPSSDRIYHLYIVDNNKHLVGVLPIRALVTANPKDMVSDIMHRHIIYLRDSSPKETAARLMARYDLFVLPVMDKEGVLSGIVKADDILDDYIPERLKRQKFLPSRLKIRKNGFSKT